MISNLTQRTSRSVSTYPSSLLTTAIRIVHGTADRATDAHATERLFARIGSTDKQLKLYDGYEHVMLKVGIDAADDEKRQRVLTDWRDWMIERTTTE
jgi:alpha-beta hydrolase superfamily lysophospholipase